MLIGWACSTVKLRVARHVAGHLALRVARQYSRLGRGPTAWRANQCGILDGLGHSVLVA